MSRGFHDRCSARKDKDWLETSISITVDEIFTSIELVGNITEKIIIRVSVLELYRTEGSQIIVNIPPAALLRERNLRDRKEKHQGFPKEGEEAPIVDHVRN